MTEVRVKFKYLAVIYLTVALYIHSTEHTHVPDALRKVVELAPALKRASKLVLLPHREALQAQRLSVPVGNVRDVALVETGTVLVVLLTSVYLLRTIVRASRRVQDVAAVNISLTKKDI